MEPCWRTTQHGSVGRRASCRCEASNRAVVSSGAGASCGREVSSSPEGCVSAGAVGPGRQAPSVMLRSSHCWDRPPAHSFMLGTSLSSSDGPSRHWLLLTCLRVSFCKREVEELKQQDNHGWKCSVVGFSPTRNPALCHPNRTACRPRGPAAELGTADGTQTQQ